ncbi:shikimate kinase [Leptospira sp. 96542]|nr:shikimate kinase [Leptospira sp. 96542]
MIQLIGPGGAGKTTTGFALANRLGVQFVDLDAMFIAAHGDVGEFIEAKGYGAYASQNVETYRGIARTLDESTVVALSSGFMIYPHSVHPDYPDIRQAIVSDIRTVLLLPSLDLELCVSETVRRQLLRPFARTAQREEQVIRTRFHAYVNLSVRRIVTCVPVCAVVRAIMDLLDENHPASLSTASARMPPPSLRPKDA